jgi:uncharacterized membrane protein
VSLEGTQRRRTPTPAVILAVLVAVAIALRFWRLGQWGFEGDEIFTLRDSIHPRLSNPRPLLYLLNYYLVLPFRPLDELGMRIIPALAGVLAIPAVYLVTQRLAGTRAALFAALLLTVSGIHVYQSQYARYWSLVFLVSTIYPYAIYLGIREHNPRTLALGILVGALAVLAHPVAGFLVGGLIVWFVISDIGRDYARRLWKHKTLRWGVLAFVVLVGVITIRYLPVLGEWIQEHDEGVTQDNLLHLPGRPGFKQIALLLSYIEGVTVPVALAGMVGIIWLWQRRERALALLLACLLICPTGLLVLLSFRTPVSITYLLPTAPVFFIGAGVFLDRLADAELGLRPRWLLPATVTIMILVTGLPTLLSQYRDGRRRDFRGVAQYLANRLGPGDGIYSDQAAVLGHYLPGRFVGRLAADPDLLERSLRELEESAHGEALWIVVPASAQGGLRTTARVGSMSSWIYENCQLRNTVGVSRLDFRQNQLQVYRCPSAPALEADRKPA